MTVEYKILVRDEVVVKFSARCKLGKMPTRPKVIKLKRYSGTLDPLPMSARKLFHALYMASPKTKMALGDFKL